MKKIVRIQSIFFMKKMENHITRLQCIKDFSRLVSSQVSKNTSVKNITVKNVYHIIQRKNCLINILHIAACLMKQLQ